MSADELSVEEVRAAWDGAPTDDAAIQLQIDAAYEQIERVGGPLGTIVEERLGGGSVIILARRASTVAKITEPSADDDLAADDFSLGSDDRSLRRLDDGTSPASAWPRGWNRIEYTAFADVASRKAVALKMVQHGLVGMPGVLGFTEANWSIQFPNGESWSTAHAGLTADVASPWHFG